MMKRKDHRSYKYEDTDTNSDELFAPDQNIN